MVIIKGCRKQELNMLAYWVRRDTDTLWEPNNRPYSNIWNRLSATNGISCGDPDRAGDLELTILCPDCCKHLGYLW